MRENFKGQNGSMGDRFAAFMVRYLPWLTAHLLAGIVFGVVFAVELNGPDMAKEYYYPVLIGIAVGLVMSVWAYFSFGRKKPEYDLSNLTYFDRGLIYGHFSGHDAVLLREAVIDMRMSDLNTSLEKLRELEEKDLFEDRRSVVAFYMGRCYQLMGYPANGAKYFREALDLGLELNDTYLLAARCLTQNGQFDEALKFYGVLLERNCPFDFILTDMGIVYLKKGESEKALEEFNKSIDEGKNYSFALGGCSLAYLQMKDIEKSREYYKKALTCNMDDVMGFKIFYCNIAEAQGLIDEIDPQMKTVREPDELIR